MTALFNIARSAPKLFGSGLGLGRGFIDDIGAGARTVGHPPGMSSLPFLTSSPGARAIPRNTGTFHGPTPPPPGTLATSPTGGGAGGGGFLGGLKTAGMYPIRHPFKTGAMGLGGAIGYNLLTGDKKDDKAPAGLMSQDDFLAGSSEAYNTPGSSYSVSGAGGLAAGSDAYAQAQANMKDYYDMLFDQAAQDTARREQVIQDIYDEQSQFNQQLMGQMRGANDLQASRVQELREDMMRDYGQMGQGMQGFAASGSAPEREALTREAMQGATDQAEYGYSVGGTLDDLLRAGAQADRVRGNEMTAQAQAQGASQQQALMMEALDRALGAQFEQAGILSRMGAESALQAQQQASENTFVQQAERPAAIQGVLKMIVGDGGSTETIPSAAQQALNTFMATGNPALLNYALYVAQNTPAGG